ncbi:MAG: pentapeptide repeat-containing protein [Rickettsiaceae bacterium]|nr:pentapeptide repeat-containing protein [Rickettsiaceae bacterium]
MFATRFERTRFVNVDFLSAELIGANFSFAIFKNSDLTSANLQASTLCGAKFIDTVYANANFRESNLVGADLYNMLLNSERFKLQPDLQGAVYNSERYNFMSGNLDKFNIPYTMYSSCGTDYFPPTKFPEGFDPEKYGMIDISKL